MGFIQRLKQRKIRRELTQFERSKKRLNEVQAAASRSERQEKIDKRIGVAQRRIERSSKTRRKNLSGGFGKTARAIGRGLQTVAENSERISKEQSVGVRKKSKRDESFGFF